jgi:hypothetical protein
MLPFLDMDREGKRWCKPVVFMDYQNHRSGDTTVSATILHGLDRCISAREIHPQFGDPPGFFCPKPLPGFGKWSYPWSFSYRLRASCGRYLHAWLLALWVWAQSRPPDP